MKPVSSFASKALFRFGFQYYDFDYTGSNNRGWGAGEDLRRELAADDSDASAERPQRIRHV